MMTISNPFASHLSAQQHAKLAAHYLSRYRLMARRLVLDNTRYTGIYATGTVIEYLKVDVVDYHTMFHKYLYHKRAAETLRNIEVQQRTEAGLVALAAIVKPANVWRIGNRA